MKSLFLLLLTFLLTGTQVLADSDDLLDIGEDPMLPIVNDESSTEGSPLCHDCGSSSNHKGQKHSGIIEMIATPKKVQGIDKRSSLDGKQTSK